MHTRSIDNITQRGKKTTPGPTRLSGTHDIYHILPAIYHLPATETRLYHGLFLPHFILIPRCVDLLTKPLPGVGDGLQGHARQRRVVRRRAVPQRPNGSGVGRDVVLEGEDRP